MIPLSFFPGDRGDLISRLPGGKVVLLERGARLPVGFGAGASWLCEIREPDGGKVAFARPIQLDPEPARKAEASLRRAAEDAARGAELAALQLRAQRGEWPTAQEMAAASGSWEIRLISPDPGNGYRVAARYRMSLTSTAEFRASLATAAVQGLIQLCRWEPHMGVPVMCDPWYLEIGGDRIPLSGGGDWDRDEVAAMVAQIGGDLGQEILARMDETPAAPPRVYPQTTGYGGGEDYEDYRRYGSDSSGNWW